ncbi:MAG: hypothetical protein GY866_26620 [Proteobacteria bacterium]|nr:hypothetical protein [Pseudomonadota bacterium]
MKEKYHTPYRSNFCCKLIFCASLFVFFAGSGRLWAVQLSGIYFSGCEREIGIILEVDDTKVTVLNLEGEIKSIRRFDIIYMAQYPVGKVTIPKIEPGEGIGIVEIKTLYENKVVDLLEGWLTDTSANKMSFLTTEGKETVVDINDVWDIDFRDQENTIFFNGNEPAKRFRFVHPYPFAACRADEEETQGLRISPHHLLGDPLLIKIELDRLQAGYEELHTYVKEKVFYPQPQVFGNISTLAIWTGHNLRYGSSTTRDSSFIPVVRSELSEGLYKFQRVIVTGTAPMPYSVHEEPQTQFYYGMKSGYFHFSFMFDLSRLLVGDDDYKWQRDDLNDIDDRQNEKMHLCGGFDWGNYAVEYAMAFVNYGVRYGDLFHSDDTNMNRVGLFYSHRLFKLALYYGFGTGENEEDEREYVASDNASQEEKDYIDYLNQQLSLKADVSLLYRYYRLNVDLSSFMTLQPKYSLIYKNTTFEREPNTDGFGNFKYQGGALTNVVYLKYDLTEEDLFFEGFLSFETANNQSGITDYTDESRNNYIKGGVNIGLVF